MTANARRKLFASIVQNATGRPCPCCIERNEFVNKGFSPEFTNTVRLFQKVFGTSVIGAGAVVAFRLVPVPKGIAKRGEDFFYLKENLFACCSNECRNEYQNMWLFHPDRVKFIEELVSIQSRGKIKLRR